MECSFTYPHYREMLSLIKQTHSFKLFSEYDKSSDKKVVLLRHDIDFSLPKALEIAKIDNGLGIKSTFFILVNTPFYKVSEEQTSEIIREIRSLGHEIGVHFDPVVYEDINESNFEERISEEAKILEGLFGSSKKVGTVSFHRFTQFMDKNKMKPKEFICTYDDVFFKDMKYLSDSRMRWRNGCPCRFFESNSIDNLHLLIHPIWWGPQERDRAEIMNGVAKENESLTLSDFENNLDFIKAENGVLVEKN